MIELWSWATPNGQKVHIALEELGLEYKARPVDLGAGAQFRPEFLALNPNHRIPAIVDTDAAGERLAVFESGAILIYLAEKAGRLLAREGAARYASLQWLMFQMGGIGPMFGQAHHFASAAPEALPYAIERFGNERARLHGVLQARLSDSEYLGGAEYSIADIATYPWIDAAAARGFPLGDYPQVQRWRDTVAARPAVIRGMALMTELRRDAAPAPRATPRVGTEIPREHAGR